MCEEEKITYKSLIEETKAIARCIETDDNTEVQQVRIWNELDGHTFLISYWNCLSVVRECYGNDGEIFTQAEELFHTMNGGYGNFKTFTNILQQLAYCVMEAYIERWLKYENCEYEAEQYETEESTEEE